ncbi:MAG TPA: hypothetical protein VGA70_01480 [Longimicrobiales bacterium]|jgi:hypothetical protein
MLGSETLDVAIGLVMVYVLLSGLSSGLRDVVANLFDHRAQHLEAGIKSLLRDGATGLARELYAHPLIQDVPERGAGGGEQKPIHIPSRSFALALVDTLGRKAPATDASPGDRSVLTLASIRAGAAKIEDDAVRRAVLTAIDMAQGDLDRALGNVESWFDSAMDRVSAWYKRQSQKIVIAAAVLVTLGLNVNTLAVIEQLSKDDALRTQLVADAVDATAPEGGDVRDQYEQLQALGLPLGWTAGWPGAQRAMRPDDDEFRLWEDAFQPALGWLITIFAVSLGAPFWFDVLGGMVRLRAGARPAGGGGGGGGGGSAGRSQGTA